MTRTALARNSATKNLKIFRADNPPFFYTMAFSSNLTILCPYVSLASLAASRLA